MFFYYLVVGSILVLLILLVIGRFAKAIAGTWAAGGISPTDADAAEQILALVFLLRGPRVITLMTVMAAARRAFDLPFAHDNPNAFVISTDRPECFIVKTPQASLEVICSGRPYRENLPGVLDRAGDWPGIRPIRQHQAWIAVDLIQDQTHAGLEDSFRYIAKLLAELAQDDCLGLFCPSTGQIVPYSAELLPLLRSFHPLDALKPSGDAKARG